MRVFKCAQSGIIISIRFVSPLSGEEAWGGMEDLCLWRSLRRRSRSGNRCSNVSITGFRDAEGVCLRKHQEEPPQRSSKTMWREARKATDALNGCGNITATIEFLFLSDFPCHWWGRSLLAAQLRTVNKSLYTREGDFRRHQRDAPGEAWKEPT